jgi:hypothetical protein
MEGLISSRHFALHSLLLAIVLALIDVYVWVPVHWTSIFVSCIHKHRGITFSKIALM